MTELRPEAAPQADPTVLDSVTLPEIPTVYALHRPEDGVTGWVFVPPGEQAFIVPLGEDGETRGTGLIHTSLDHVLSFWAPRADADLVRITDRRPASSSSAG